MKNLHTTLIILILLLSTVAIGLILFKKYHKKYESEAFTQEKPFVAKYNADIYDNFYSEIYDTINKPERRVSKELKTIIDTTQASDKSVFLDIGSGTGCVVNELSELGFDAYGIDNSKAMVNYSEKNYPDILVKKGDALDTMAFEKGVFSHILCLYFTIYQFKDKRTFFRNCYFWLKPGGYLVVHLVDKHKFDTTVPAAINPIFGAPQRFNEEKSRNSIVQFYDFKYKANYKFSEKNSTVTFTETFTDKFSNKTRQNEQTLYMEDLQEIIAIANANGFIPHSKFDMRNINFDEDQYLYIFERSL